MGNSIGPWALKVRVLLWGRRPLERRLSIHVLRYRTRYFGQLSLNIVLLPVGTFQYLSYIVGRCLVGFCVQYIQSHLVFQFMDDHIVFFLQEVQLIPPAAEHLVLCRELADNLPCRM